MKIHLLVLLVFPAALYSQKDSIAAVEPVGITDTDTLIPIPVVEKDTLNVTDSLGRKQGYWLFFGSDFPNSGVASTEILEEGYFENNERTGIWYRYGAHAQLKAVMLFRIDKKTKAAVRDQFYNYSYHANGQLKRKPVVGACRTMSDFYQYDESGQLIEAELFDSLCNTTYKLQQIKKGELDSLSIFAIDARFTEATDAALTADNVTFRDLGQSGEYCIDYNHRTFQVGTFEKGRLIQGREFTFDDMMRAQRVRYYESGKVVKTLVKGAPSN